MVSFRSSTRCNAMILPLLVLGSARAATLQVDAAGGADYSTIQAAVAAASAGDTVQVAPGTYTGSVDLGGKGLAIVATGGSSATTLDATGSSTAFVLQRGEQDVQISGFTVLNDGGRGVYASRAGLTLADMAFQGLGDASLNGGSIYASASDLVIEDSSFDDGQAAQGGQVYVNGGTLTVTDTVMDNGYAATSGGAIYANVATVSLSGVELTYASAVSGGGALLLWNSPATVADSSFEGNATELGHGGAVYASGQSLAVQGSSFTSNYCEGYAGGYSGGAIYAAYSPALTIEDSSFDSNYNYNGGAIYAEQCATTLTGGSFSKNQSYYGGSGYANGGSWTETGVTHSENSGQSGAGALAIAYADLDLRGSSFDGNIATYGHGGAIYLYSYGDYSAAVTDASFVDNYAYYGGGAIMAEGVYQGTTVTRCSFEDNQGLYSNGGAIRSYYYSPLTVADTSFDGNLSETDGGALSVEYNSPLTASGSSFTDNSSGSTGGAINFLAYSATDLVMSQSIVEGNAARFEGGGLRAASASLDLERTDFVGNTAEELGFGGGMRLSTIAAASIRDLRIEANAATYGGGLYIDLSSPIDARNITVLANTAQHGGGAALVESEALSLTSSALVANHAELTGAALYQYQSPIALGNSIVAHHTGSAALYTGSSVGVGDSTVRWTVFWDNAEGHGGGAWAGSDLPGTDTFELDPGFARPATQGGATLVLARDSQLIDLGDPMLDDLDGSRADPGRWGGPSVLVQDADADGFDSNSDCDDTDATVFPGASETWYDGFDQNCLLTSDYDADGDGAEAMAYGGEDCDDADASVVDCPDQDGGSEDGGAEEDPTQDGGSDTDPGDGGASGQPGGGVDGEEDSGKGCSTAPGAVSLVLVLLAGLTTGRRRTWQR